MLIAMAGLPGTGKTTLARSLAGSLNAIVLNKDTIRAALFPAETVEYSSEQDDLCVEVMLQVAAFLLKRDPDRAIILDGRTFSRQGQVQTVTQAASDMAAELIFIECTCSEATSLRRLREDRLREAHVAENRDAALYHRLKGQADPLKLPHLIVDTDAPLDTVVDRCLFYLTSRRTLPVP